MFQNPEQVLLIASVILFLSIFAGKAGYRFGLPALLLFLGVGMLFGSDGHHRLCGNQSRGLQILAEYNNNPFDIKAFCVKPQDSVVYHFRILSPRILVCQCFVTKSERKPRKTEVFRGKG